MPQHGRRPRRGAGAAHRLATWALAVALAALAAGCGPEATAARVAAGTGGAGPQARTGPAPFVPFWVRNHRMTELWSGRAGSPGVVSFGRTSERFCTFRVVRPQDGARLYVLNPYTANYAWIDAAAVGPVGEPELRPGPPPPGRTCAPVVYDASPAPAEPRLVLALYYAWFDLGTWEEETATDRPQIPYSSADPVAIRRHVAWAREAGIDVLVSAWYGPKDGNPTEANLRRLLDEAGHQGRRAAILLETDSRAFFPDRPSMVRALRHALKVHATHPAYMRVGGRPVILAWRPIAAFGADGRRVDRKAPEAVAAWRALLDEVDPGRRALWIAEGDYFPFLEVFDGIFPYSIAWSPDPVRQLSAYGQKVRAWSAEHGARRFWAATAMPGYDDTRIPGRAGAFAVDRADGAYYERTFRGAIDSDPAWVIITSFNEWLKGTQIEPSPRYGRRYLDLTRALSDHFKARL